ncbi:hypothetical protein [Enterovibrio norvegicus]|uniref:hypothetical protein n=1 Tax=Enterovibrio norvegicus TaxID=188144 RepID=UPI00352C3C73
MQLLTNAEIRALNVNETQQHIHKIDAHIYWCSRGLNSTSNRMKASFLRQKKTLNKRLKSGRVVPELSECGNVIVRSSFPHSHLFENYYHKLGYTRMTGGDGYAFSMVNKKKLIIVSYCEGDVTEVTSSDEASFVDELEFTELFYI